MKQWQGRTDGGDLGLKFLFWLLRFIPLKIAYLFVLPAIPFYIICRPKSRKSIYSFYFDRMKLSKCRSFVATCRLHYVFGKVLMDKLLTLTKTKVQFIFDIVGNDEFYKLLDNPEGFMILGAHVGNFEIAGYLLKQNVKRINSPIYADEVPVLIHHRSKKFDESNVKLLPMTDDFSYIFALNTALDNGEIVCLASDRSAGSDKEIKMSFLNEEASFPLGPFLLATTKEVEVLTLFIMKGKGNVYHAYVKNITVKNHAINNKKEQIALLVQNYVNELENIVKLYPEQWFNFYDFWNKK